MFAIELKKENKALSPDDPFPEDRLQIEVIHKGDEAWEWTDYLRSRIRIARAMAVFVPAGCRRPTICTLMRTARAHAPR